METPSIITFVFTTAKKKKKKMASLKSADILQSAPSLQWTPRDNAPFVLTDTLTIVLTSLQNTFLSDP